LGGTLDTEGGVAKGQIAMILDGPWYPPTLTAQYPNANVGTALVPAGKGGSISVVGGEDIVISQESQNKDAAMAFVRFMLSEDTQMKFGAIGQMPVLKSSTTPANLAKLPSYYPIFLQQLATSQARTPISNWNQMETILTDAGTAILNGSETAQAGLTAAAAKIDPLLPTIAPTATPAS
jgi:multiple sugar transport system substrate-binding protein